MLVKKYITSFLLLLLCGCSNLMGQATVAAEIPKNVMGLPEIMFMVLVASAALIMITALWVIVRANTYVTKRILRLEAIRQGIAVEEDPMPETEGEDFWDRLRKRYWENPVEREREHEIMFHHAYDGIRELDNHLPPWWVNMFIITVIWAVGYMWYYHWGGNGPDQIQEYKTSVEVAKKETALALAGKADAISEADVVALTEPGALADGAAIFKSVCAACHGQLGEGSVGPNLTDAQWVHGGGIKNVFKTIKYGVPEKGMIAWAAQLRPSDMQKVSSYILTLKGTNPPNAKAPQGEVWVEQAADTTSTK